MALVAAAAMALFMLSPALAQTENQAPEPVEDTATTALDTAVEIDVLANDSDPDGDSIVITEWTQGANGTVEVNDAIVTYTPNAAFTGDDTFEYTVSDGELTTTATVTVTVGDDGGTENQAPEPVEDTAATALDTAVEIDVLANDSDPDGDSIFISEWTQGENGTVEVNDAIVTYTPNAGFTGDDTFEYTVSDGELTATTMVAVTVEGDAGSPLESQVVEACESYTGDDPTILRLCEVYLTGELSPFVQQIVGSIIVLTIPPVEVDPVIEACEANAGDPLVDALCNLYQMEQIPEHLKTSVGEWILEIAAEEDPVAEPTDE